MLKMMRRLGGRAVVKALRATHATALLPALNEDPMNHGDLVLYILDVFFEE